MFGIGIGLGCWAQLLALACHCHRHISRPAPSLPVSRLLFRSCSCPYCRRQASCQPTSGLPACASHVPTRYLGTQSTKSDYHPWVVDNSGQTTCASFLLSLHLHLSLHLSLSPGWLGWTLGPTNKKRPSPIRLRPASPCIALLTSLTYVHRLVCITITSSSSSPSAQPVPGAPLVDGAQGEAYWSLHLWIADIGAGRGWLRRARLRRKRSDAIELTWVSV